MDANTQMEGIQFSGENVFVSVYDQLTTFDEQGNLLSSRMKEYGSEMERAINMSLDSFLTGEGENKDSVFRIRRYNFDNIHLAIPCSPDLIKILEKYNYDIPHLSDQNINDNIKEIARLAGLDEKVSITSTRGGKPVTEMIEKWKLVHSHTARRTGATLMYLSGMDIYDILKITGHSTPIMLKKYIKADELEENKLEKT